MKKIIFTGLLLAGLHSLLVAQDSTSVFKTVSSLKEALAMAKKEHKMLFVDCYFQGCAPCAQMDREVFPNSTVRPALEKDFVPVKVDVYKNKWGDSISMQYAVSGFPSLLVLNEDGKLINRATGYKDAGQFLQLLAESKTKNNQQRYLTGFGTPGADNSPAYYKESYRQNKSTQVEASKFIRAQKDWLEDKAGFAILTSQNLDKDVEDFLIKNYQAFMDKYGAELVQYRIERILVNRMTSAVHRQKNEPAFQQFLKEYESYFPKAYWKNCLQILATAYYVDIAKDTTAYLQFMSANPVIYRYYFSAFFGTMVMQKNDSPENCKLMAKWADGAINVETSLELIQIAASVHKGAGNMEGYRKYIRLCLEKVAKYNMKGKEYYEKLLTAI